MEYQIGDFSRIARLSVKTLRFYHEQGLLEPVRIDPSSGYRYYSDRSLERAQAIERLKDLEFSLKEIKEILDQYKDDEEILGFLSRKAKEVADRIRGYQRVHNELLILLKAEREAALRRSDQQVVEKSLPPLLVASLRYRGRYDEVGVYIGRLFGAIARYAAGPPFCLYHDGEYMEEGADIEVCVPLRQEPHRALAGEIRTQTLPACRALCLLHRGPYAELHHSYRKVFEVAGGKGQQTLAPIRETYLKGPGVIFKGNPKNYLTELQVPLS